MKKFAFWGLIMLLFATAFAIPSLTCGDKEYAFAQGEAGIERLPDEEIEKELNEQIDKNLSALIGAELEEYFLSLEGKIQGTNAKSLLALVKGIIDGESPLSVDLLFEMLFNAARDELGGIIIVLITIIVLALLGGLSDGITSGFGKSGTSTLIHWAVYGGIVVTLSIAVNGLIIGARDTINAIAALINYTFPVFVTLLTALGGVGGSAVLAPLTLLIGNTVSSIIIAIVMPLFYATLVFTVVGNMSDNVKLGKLTKALKSVGGWILGITFGIITFIVAIQGMVGAGVDTIAFKSAKFALSSYIPILGGYISEGFDLVLASCVLIKNAFGLSVFIMLIAIIVAPMVKILMFSLALKLVAGLIEPVSNSKVSELLYGTATNLNLLLSAVAGMAFIVFIVLLLVIGTFNAGVV